MSTMSETRTQRNSTSTAGAHARRHRNGHAPKHEATTRERLHEMGEIAKDLAHEKIDQVRDFASEQAGQGQEKVQELGRTFTDSIREKPVRSMLIAAGVGLLLGRFWMRR